MRPRRSAGWGKNRRSEGDFRWFGFPEGATRAYGAQAGFTKVGPLEYHDAQAADGPIFVRPETRRFARDPKTRGAALARPGFEGEPRVEELKERPWQNPHVP